MKKKTVSTKRATQSAIKKLVAADARRRARNREFDHYARIYSMSPQDNPSVSRAANKVMDVIAQLYAGKPLTQRDIAKLLQ